MSLKDDLLGNAGKLIDDKGADWLDKLELSARDETGSIATAASGLLDGVTVTEDQVDDVLDVLSKGKAPLLRLTSVSFAWIVANVESGDELEARRLYLETEATFAERNAAMDSAGDGAFDEGKERSDAWEATKDVLEAVGEVGLTILVAIVRKAVGI